MLTFSPTSPGWPTPPGIPDGPCGRRRENSVNKYIAKQGQVWHFYFIYESKDLDAVFFFLVSFISSYAHRRLKLEQNYPNTRKKIESQVCYAGRFWVTLGRIVFPFLNLFLCECAREYVCMHVCLCVLSWDEQSKSMSSVECTNMRAEYSHALLLSSCCQLLLSHDIPPHFAPIYYYCIIPFMNLTISTLLYFNSSSDEALAWLTEIFCSSELNNWLVWEAVEKRPLLEVNITASSGW